MQRFLDKQKWAELEFLRLALLARAAWAQNQNRAGDSLWGAATRAASNRLGPLTLLLSLAADWKRDQEDLLWEIVQRFPAELWALHELEQRYVTERDTRGLNRVCRVLVNSGPGGSNWTNRNNLAATSMLLQVDLPRAYETARELFRQNPKDPILASTYAYSLHLQGQTLKGLAILDELDEASRRSPALALYYGILLAAAGQTDRAGPYLALAETVNLLPEEIELLARARKPERLHFTR